MKIKSYELSFSVKPKQKKGRIVISNYGFTIRPKPKGVLIRKQKLDRVTKTDSMFGVSISKHNLAKIHKQVD